MNSARKNAQPFLKRLTWLAVLLGCGLLAACQPKSQTVLLLDEETAVPLMTQAATVSEALAGSGFALDPADRLLLSGKAIPPETPLADCPFPCTLRIRRAISLTIRTPEEEIRLRTAAATLGEALEEAGLALSLNDRFSLPLETPLTGDLTVHWTPARALTVHVDGREVTIRSAAETVGEALAEAGYPLTGLDTSRPAPDAPLPEDGQIHIIRVVETITTTPKILPYSKRIELSADLELDQIQLLQSGEPGLAIVRIRTRSEDGVPVAETTEAETVVRPPQDQVTLYGTRVVMKTAVVDGITITYWRALPFYATSYHPVTSDITASGKRVRIGLAGIDPRYIPYGTQMYVPGYGYAEAADTGAISGRWIDLAYPPESYVPWHKWVTVYFLWPPPNHIPYYIPPPCSTLTGYCPPPP